MNADELKKKMGHGLRPLYKDLSLTLANGEQVALCIRRPKPNEAEVLVREAAALGLSEGRVESAADMFPFMRKVVAATVFAPGAVVPLYTAEGAGDCDYLGELFREAMPALTQLGAAVEDAKGNSSATPTAP